MKKKQKGKIEPRERKLVVVVVVARYEWNVGMIRMEIVESKGDERVMKVVKAQKSWESKRMVSEVAYE